ncbi:MAG: hypothetical protein WC307_03415 [Candidatus Nanoarchaeia archaeon]
MFKGYLLAGTLLLIVLIAGCATNTPAVTNCNDYCLLESHESCDGEWSISGEYPNCTCGWVCDDTCTPDWSCTEWNDCNVTNLQTKHCIDLNECGINTNKPAESQACTFINFCDSISSANLKANCNAFLYNDVSKCPTESTTFYENCAYDLAKITFNITVCDSINTTYTRNVCKAIVKNNLAYCNILIPINRTQCYEDVYAFLNYRASFENNSYYCGLIINTTLYPNCANQPTRNTYLNHYSNYSICERYFFDYNSTDYQSIFACYSYHVKTDNTKTVCESIKNIVNMTDLFYDECIALADNNITYCYDFNGTLRDRCLANFAYLRNDTDICRDASNRDNCNQIVCGEFGYINFCDMLTTTVTRNVEVYNLAIACLSNNWASCNMGYCDLLTDQVLKDSCIYYIYRYEKMLGYNYRNYI